jgi:hypothetical protein
MYSLSHTVSHFFAATAVGLSLPAFAEAEPLETQRERDPIGLYRQPVCDIGYRVKSLLTNIARQMPTGLKASSSRWEMEIFQNPETLSWTLVGKSLAPEDAHSSKLCRIAGAMGTTYSNEKWFHLYFTSK